MALGLLQFFIALYGIRLVFDSPLGHLTVGLGHGSLKLSFGLLLLLKLLPQEITIMAGRLESMGQGTFSLTKEIITDKTKKKTQVMNMDNKVTECVIKCCKS